MLSTASTVRIVVPCLVAVAASVGALFFFGLPQVPHELPVNAGTLATSGSTVGATAASPLSGLGDKFTPVFDIARVESTGEAVIAGRAAPGVTVELLREGYVHDRAVADPSGQFVMVPPRLPSGEYELTLRSRQPDGKEAASQRSVMVTLQPKMLASTKQAGVASGPREGKEATIPPKMTSVPITLDKQEDGTSAYLQGDYAAALRLFQPLAERGDASAQSNLGLMYEQGRGVGKDYRQAMKWFRLAAIQGNASAQSNLGVMYYKGEGIAQDYGEAMKWYHLAAEQGNPEAQFNLGVMYEQGRGSASDRVRAHMWFNLAAAVSAGGNAKLAAKNRDGITKRLTREQLFRAQELAHECEASSFKNCD